MLTINEAADQIGLQHNTLRKYLDYFTLTVEKQGRKLLLPDVTVQFLVEITRLKSNNWSLKQIKDFLDKQKEGEPENGIAVIIPEVSDDQVFAVTEATDTPEPAIQMESALRHVSPTDKPNRTERLRDTEDRIGGQTTMRPAPIEMELSSGQTNPGGFLGGQTSMRPAPIEIELSSDQTNPGGFPGGQTTMRPAPIETESSSDQTNPGGFPGGQTSMRPAPIEIELSSGQTNPGGFPGGQTSMRPAPIEIELSSDQTNPGGFPGGQTTMRPAPIEIELSSDQTNPGESDNNVRPPLTKDFVNREIAVQAKRTSRLYHYLGSRRSPRETAELQAILDKRVIFLNGLRYIRDNWIDHLSGNTSHRHREKRPSDRGAESNEADPVTG